MSDQTYRPGKDRTVPLEDGRPWPTGEDGAVQAITLPDTRYWRRRIEDGDVVPVKADAPARQRSQQSAE